jgi:hypothetical protein
MSKRDQVVLRFSVSRSSTGDDWVPTYPPFDQFDEISSVQSETSKSVTELRGMWQRHSQQTSERMFKSTSPVGTARAMNTSREDLATTKRNDIDGESISAQSSVSILRSPTSTLRSLPRVGEVTPRKNKPLPPLHPLSDHQQTIPILPSNANAVWPPRTPKHGGPSSDIKPRFTPAPVPIEVLEQLMPLTTPPDLDDQYELTEWENSADESAEGREEEKERKRAAKRIPAWCIGWIETARDQTKIDPETVFGRSVPRCDLSVIFQGHGGNAYMKARKGKRNSSGEWGMDIVSMAEIEAYRQTMGQTDKLDSVFIISKQ